MRYLALRRLTVAEPMKPLQPVTKTVSFVSDIGMPSQLRLHECAYHLSPRRKDAKVNQRSLSWFSFASLRLGERFLPGWIPLACGSGGDRRRFLLPRHVVGAVRL